jgi:hypothetical protein
MPEWIVECRGSAVARGLGAAVQLCALPYCRRRDGVAVRHLEMQRHGAASRGVGLTSTSGNGSAIISSDSPILSSTWPTRPSSITYGLPVSVAWNTSLYQSMAARESLTQM